MDITKLNLSFAEATNGIKNESISEMFRNIYLRYIPSNSDCCLNLPSKMRKKYIRSFLDFEKENGTSTPNENDKLKLYSLTGDDGEIDPDFFNDAEKECWQLMASDSLLHFKSTDMYKHMVYEKE